MWMDEMILYIKSKLPEEELFTQLAEEAAELAQAALKVRRVIDGRNPTPVSFEEAQNSLNEEVNDVIVCLMALGFVSPRDSETHDLVYSKIYRWFSRLGGAGNDE